MVEKVNLTNIFHHSNLQNLARPTFSTFPRISEKVLYMTKMVEKLAWPTFSTTQAVLEAQIVENVGQAKFFHFFHKFLRKSLES